MGARSAWWWSWSLIVACEPVEGEGEVLTEARTVEAFVEAQSNNGIALELVVDAEEADPEGLAEVALEVAAQENLLPLIDTEVVDDRLRVDVSQAISADAAPRVTGTVSSLRFVGANNGAAVEVRGLEGANLSLDANNGGTVRASGDVLQLVIEADNAAAIDASELPAVDATVAANNGAAVVVCASGAVTGTVDNGASLEVQCGGTTSGVTASNGGSVSP